MTKYKKYEYDASVPIPRSTQARRKKAEKAAQRSLLEELNPNLLGGHVDLEESDTSLHSTNSEAQEVNLAENVCNEMVDSDTSLHSSHSEVQVTDLADNDCVSPMQTDMSDLNSSVNTSLDSSQATSQEQSESSTDSEDEHDFHQEDPNCFHDFHQEDPNCFNELRGVLCGCTETTVGEALVMVLAIGMRHIISWVGMVDILKMINVLFGRKVVPDTKYLFLKHLDRYDANDVTYHNYCSSCGLYLGKGRKANDLEQCPCGQDQKIGYFLTLGMQKQIEDLLKEREVADGLQYGLEGRRSGKDRLCDIYDGEVYKSLNSPGGPLYNSKNLTYTFNTDGISCGKHSKRSMWPIYAVINELPPKLRSKHMILAGVWVSAEQPNMTIFLSSFVEEARHLSETGIRWQYRGENVISKLIPVCACVDSPARSKILNFRNSHGLHSCTFCYHPGDRVRGLIGFRYSALNVDVPQLRTHEEITSDMLQAFENRDGPKRGRVVRGVRGPSPLMSLPHFDMGSMIVTDIMHLFGLVETMMLRFMNPKWPGAFHLDEEQVSRISSRFCSIAPPKSIRRSPRSLKQLKLFTCSELRSWLILYGPVCMKGILPPKYLAHFTLFSSAIRLLSKKSVSMSDIEKANELLIKFVVLYQQYYGLESMTINVHLLTHLCRCVFNFGPLWTHSCFPFETENRYLLNLMMSPAAVAEQIIRKFLCFKNIDGFCDQFGVAYDVRDFVESLSTRRHKYFTRSDDCVLLGCAEEVVLNADEQRLVSDLQLGDVQRVFSFQTVLRGCIRLTTSAYAQGLKINDSAIALRNGAYVEIVKIYHIICDGDSRVVFLVREYVCSNTPVVQYEDIKYTDVKEVTRMGRVRAVSPREIVGQCVVMCFDDIKYVTEIPFGCYGD